MDLIEHLKAEYTEFVIEQSNHILIYICFDELFNNVLMNI